MIAPSLAATAFLCCGPAHLRKYVSMPPNAA